MEDFHHSLNLKGSGTAVLPQTRLYGRQRSSNMTPMEDVQSVDPAAELAARQANMFEETIVKTESLYSEFRRIIKEGLGGMVELNAKYVNQIHSGKVSTKPNLIRRFLRYVVSKGSGMAVASVFTLLIVLVWGYSRRPEL